jgi:hypothetical protein
MTGPRRRPIGDLAGGGLIVLVGTGVFVLCRLFAHGMA